MYPRNSLSWLNLTLTTHPIIYLIPLGIPSHDSVYLILGLPTHALKTGKSDCGPARALQSQPPLWTDSLAPVRFVIDRYSICNTMWFESWQTVWAFALKCIRPAGRQHDAGGDGSDHIASAVGGGVA